jgi:hypothetical protein
MRPAHRPVGDAACPCSLAPDRHERFVGLDPTWLPPGHRARGGLSGAPPGQAEHDHDDRHDLYPGRRRHFRVRSHPYGGLVSRPHRAVRCPRWHRGAPDRYELRVRGFLRLDPRTLRPGHGQARHLHAGPRRRGDDVHRRRRERAPRPLHAHRLAHADGDDPARQAHRQPQPADQGLRAARRRSTTSCSAPGIPSRTMPTPRPRRPACSR